MHKNVRILSRQGGGIICANNICTLIGPKGGGGGVHTSLPISGPNKQIKKRGGPNSSVLLAYSISSLLPDPPPFSLPTTFKGLVSLSSFVHGYNQLIEAVPLGLSRTSQLRSINCHRTKTFFDFKDFFRNKQISTTCLSLTMH
jgi:hypothetical protein